MKKISLLFSLLCVLLLGSKSALAYIATITGPLNVCPNQNAVEYLTQTNVPSYLTISKVVFTCGGVGVFDENKSNVYTIYQTTDNVTGHSISCPRSSSVHVNWSNSFGVQSWVQVKYYWDVAFINYSAVGTLDNINIGQSTEFPTGLAGPLSLCGNNMNNFIVSCPNALPANAVGWDWSFTNASLTPGTGGQTNTLSLYPTSSSPIVVSARFHFICNNAHYYSKGYSITIGRTLGVPASATVEVIQDACASTYNFTAPPFSTVQTSSSSTGPWGATSSFNVIYPHTRTIYVRTLNDCGASAPISYILMGA